MRIFVYQMGIFMKVQFYYQGYVVKYLELFHNIILPFYNLFSDHKGFQYSLKYLKKEYSIFSILYHKPSLNVFHSFLYHLLGGKNLQIDCV